MNAVVKSAFVFEINNENVCSVLVQFVWLVMQKFFRSIKSIDVCNWGGWYSWCSSQNVFPYTWGGVSNIRNCTKESEPNWVLLVIGVPYGRMKNTVRAVWRNRTGEMWTPNGCYLQCGGVAAKQIINYYLMKTKQINQWQRSKNMCSNKIIRLHTLKSTL